MNDKTSKLTDKVNVTMHISSIADKAVSYARVQRSTGYIGNVIDKVLEKEKIMSRESLLYAAGVLRNGILDLLKSGNAVDVFELGTMFLKPTASMNTLNPDITDVPTLTVGFTPSALATQAVQDIAISADITANKIPTIYEFMNVSKESNALVAQPGDTIRLNGEYLKVLGLAEQNVGVYFAPVDSAGNHSGDENHWTEITADRLVNNTNSWLMFNVPKDIAQGEYHIIVRTACSSANKAKKTIKTGVFDQVVTIMA